MKSGTAASLFMNPFLVWSRLAWRTGEMALAATQVINHRAGRLALAGPRPTVRDQAEFALMGQEKGAAVVASAQAMGMPMLILTSQFAGLAFKQMLSTSLAMMSIAASRTAAESAQRQLKLVSSTLNGSMIAASKLSGSTARVARSALKPVHARVAGNARRLRKR